MRYWQQLLEHTGSGLVAFSNLISVVMTRRMCAQARGGAQERKTRVAAKAMQRGLILFCVARRDPAIAGQIFTGGFANSLSCEVQGATNIETIPVMSCSFCSGVLHSAAVIQLLEKNRNQFLTGVSSCNTPEFLKGIGKAGFCALFWCYHSCWSASPARPN